MSTDHITEARRQIEICNACRYCEGYCSVFPAITRQRAFADGDITQLANLCHNCRGCYYACQYTEPHEFALNLPAVLSEVRVDSWEKLAWPNGFARRFQRSGVAIAFSVLLGFTVIFWVISTFQPSGGRGFYTVLSHNAMVAIFAPAFLLPLASIAISLRKYWKTVGAKHITFSAVSTAFIMAGRMKNLDGGQGQGCNYEDTDRYSNARRHAHQATMWGFLLCFASTSSATVLHYVFDLPAPYGLFSPPKLLGILGGILLCLGTLMLAILKVRADRSLGATSVWGGEMAFIALLFFVAATGFGLYVLGDSSLLSGLMAVHLGAVVTFFLLMPYSKMVHGFYRLAALIMEAGENQQKTTR